MKSFRRPFLGVLLGLPLALTPASAVRPPAPPRQLLAPATLRTAAGVPARRPLAPPDPTLLAGKPGSEGKADGQGAAARFKHPSGVAVDAAGTLYVADAGNHTIRKITADGAVSTLAGKAGSAGSADGAGATARFSSPSGVAVDAAGTLYVTDAGNHTIRKITPAGAVTTLAGTAGSKGNADGPGPAARFASPHGVAVNAAGTVYVADAVNGTVREISPAGVVRTLAGQADRSGQRPFLFPDGLAVNAAGILYLTDNLKYAVYTITPDGKVATLAGHPGQRGTNDATDQGAYFFGPSGVAVTGSGVVYVADEGNQGLRCILPGGITKTFMGPKERPRARFVAPSGVAVNAQGTVYLTDTGDHTVRVL